METKDGLLLLFSVEETQPWYEEFLYGIEEEGIPLYCLNGREEALPSYDALSLADLAARYCCFDLGIGADEEYLVIRHRLQNDDIPLLQVSLRKDEPEKIRRAGHNTARIIKSIPLRLDNVD